MPPDPSENSQLRTQNSALPYPTGYGTENTPIDTAFKIIEEARPPKARSGRRLTVCKAADIPPGQRRIVTDGPLSIGIFNLAGNFYALRNVCPHYGDPCARAPSTPPTAPAMCTNSTPPSMAASSAAPGTAGNSTSSPAKPSSTNPPKSPPTPSKSTPTAISWLSSDQPQPPRFRVPRVWPHPAAA